MPGSHATRLASRARKRRPEALRAARSAYGARWMVETPLAGVGSLLTLGNLALVRIAGQIRVGVRLAGIRRGDRGRAIGRGVRAADLIDGGAGHGIRSRRRARPWTWPHQGRLWTVAAAAAVPVGSVVAV